MGFPGKDMEWFLGALTLGIFLTQGLTDLFCFAGRFFATEPPEKLI